METETPVETSIDTSVEKKDSTITPSSFPIQIKYINSDGTIDGMRNIQITVKRTDLIAEVKQKYIDSGKCVSPDYIVLCYNGNELSDNTTVMENDLRENATVFHQYSNITPFSKVNYRELAQHIHDEAMKNKYDVFILLKRLEITIMLDLILYMVCGISSGRREMNGKRTQL